MDASLEGESMAANMRNILDSSNERDEVVSEDQLEDVIKAEESSVLKRSDTLCLSDSFLYNILFCLLF